MATTITKNFKKEGNTQKNKNTNLETMTYKQTSKTKKKVPKAHWDKKSTKIQWSLLCVGHLLLVMGPALKCG